MSKVKPDKIWGDLKFGITQVIFHSKKGLQRKITFWNVKKALQRLKANG